MGEQAGDTAGVGWARPGDMVPSLPYPWGLHRTREKVCGGTVFNVWGQGWVPGGTGAMGQPEPGGKGLGATGMGITGWGRGASGWGQLRSLPQFPQESSSQLGTEWQGGR